MDGLFTLRVIDLMFLDLRGFLLQSHQTFSSVMMMNEAKANSLSSISKGRALIVSIIFCWFSFSFVVPEAAQWPGKENKHKKCESSHFNLPIIQRMVMTPEEAIRVRVCGRGFVHTRLVSRLRGGGRQHDDVNKVGRNSDAQQHHHPTSRVSEVLRKRREALASNRRGTCSDKGVQKEKPDGMMKTSIGMRTENNLNTATSSKLPRLVSPHSTTTTDASSNSSTSTATFPSNPSPHALVDPREQDRNHVHVHGETVLEKGQEQEGAREANTTVACRRSLLSQTHESNSEYDALVNARGVVDEILGQQEPSKKSRKDAHKQHARGHKDAKKSECDDDEPSSVSSLWSDEPQRKKGREKRRMYSNDEGMDHLVDLHRRRKLAVAKRAIISAGEAREFGINKNGHFELESPRPWTQKVMLM
jgi:hypothetical protein